jgi:Fe2+ transport system protein FeoA
VLSSELEQIIAAKLGDPTHDPHGDPIPSADFSIEELATRSLDELKVGEAGVFARVSDSDPDMLRYLAERSIRPGERFEVLDRQPFGGPLTVRLEGGAEHALGGELARAMRSRGRDVSKPPVQPEAVVLDADAPAGHPPLTQPEPLSPLRSLRSRPVRGKLALLGPAFVAAVAYVDPGNFATNITAGARYGYLLVWVIVAANLIAMLVQYLSAKIGIASEPA